VHETSLLAAVRACYHIHLVSKNMVNKTTAKATLTQMLNIVFQRMEAYDQRVRATRRANKKSRRSMAEAIHNPVKQHLMAELSALDPHKSGKAINRARLFAYCAASRAGYCATYCAALVSEQICR
jgi:hypothetical protein